MRIIKGKEQEYKEWREANTDPYGNTIFEYAERWADLLEKKLDEHPDYQQSIMQHYAEKTSHEADTEGITGFMYGAAVSILAQCWTYGEALRKWHNGEYGYHGKGTANPAVITIGK